MPKAGKTNVDKIRAMVDTERLRYDVATDILRTEWEDVREWADLLSSLATFIEQAADELDQWHEEEEREARAEARDEVLGSLETVLQTIDELDALQPLPDFTETPIGEQDW